MDIQKVGTSELRSDRSIIRVGRVKNRGKVVCKGFCNKLRLRNNFVANCSLDNIFIPFKFRNIFSKVLWLGPEIIISSFIQSKLTALIVVLASLR
jgi:hypothetical protein